MAWLCPRRMHTYVTLSADTYPLERTFLRLALQIWAGQAPCTETTSLQALRISHMQCLVLASKVSPVTGPYPDFT